MTGLPGDAVVGPARSCDRQRPRDYAALGGTPRAVPERLRALPLGEEARHQLLGEPRVLHQELQLFTGLFLFLAFGLLLHWFDKLLGGDGFFEQGGDALDEELATLAAQEADADTKLERALAEAKARLLRELDLDENRTTSARKRSG